MLHRTDKYPTWCLDSFERISPNAFENGDAKWRGICCMDKSPFLRNQIASCWPCLSRFLSTAEWNWWFLLRNVPERSNLKRNISNVNNYFWMNLNGEKLQLRVPTQTLWVSQIKLGSMVTQKCFEYYFYTLHTLSRLSHSVELAVHAQASNMRRHVSVCMFQYCLLKSRDFICGLSPLFKIERSKRGSNRGYRYVERPR